MKITDPNYCAWNHAICECGHPMRDQPCSTHTKRSTMFAITIGKVKIGHFAKVTIIDASAQNGDMNRDHTCGDA